MKAAVAAMLALALLLSGCADNKPKQPGQVCAQVITSAVAPDGTCKDYPTPCDVPQGHTKVDSCPAASPEPPEAEPKYRFETTLQFCSMETYPAKAIFFYRIKTLGAAPTVKSKVWLFIPSLDYAESRTIQNVYGEGRTLWEEKEYSYLGNTYRGQDWEVRGDDVNGPHDFKLILCEPQFALEGTCNENSGILLDSGNVAERCEGPPVS